MIDEKTGLPPAEGGDEMLDISDVDRSGFMADRKTYRDRYAPPKPGGGDGI